MPPEALEGIFVQRQDLARQILERIRTSALDRCQQHTLVIGPRGIGKTHLISLTYYRLQKMTDLRERLCVAWLREEEWEITSFLDFLLRILHALDSDGETDAPTSQRVNALYNLPPVRAEMAATSALMDLLGSRTLLILMENMDELLQRIGPDGCLRLQRFLKDHTSCIILASSQVALEEIPAPAANPFPGACLVHQLQELTHEDAMCLLAKIADYRGDRELSAFLATPRGQARMRALKYLAGGNHRAYVIFSQFLTRESLDELIEPLMRTIDDLTPYYQARMAWLSPQQRKIIAFICEYRHAVPVREIARRCFVKPENIAIQLEGLRKNGYLHSFAVGADKYFELREPLMRLSIEVKKHRGKPVGLLIDFLRLWYSPAELQQRLTSLPSDAALERAYALPALQATKEDGEHPRIPICCAEYRSAIEQGDFERALHAAEELVTLRGRVEDLSAQGYCLRSLDRYEEAAECYNTLVKLSPKDALAWTLRGIVLHRLDQHEEALRSYDKAIEVNPNEAKAWCERGAILHSTGHPDQALASFEKAVKLDPDDSISWIRRGMALAELACYEEASASFAAATELEPLNEMAYVYNCAALIELKRFVQALPLAQRALDIDPELALAWALFGYAQAGTGHYQEALTSIDRAIDLGEQTSFVLFKRAEILLTEDRWREGASALDDALSRFCHSENPNAGNTVTFVRLLERYLHDEKGLLLRIRALVLLHQKHDALSALAHALVESIPDLLLPVFGDATARRWQVLWHEQSVDSQEFRLPLRLLDSAVAYRETQDLRVLMELPLEERVLLEPLLGVQVQATA
jgi:tetratricopeptide (TPR) repeat protein